MLMGIKQAEVFRSTLFASKSEGITTACFRGEVLGSGFDAREVIEKGLFFMATHGVKQRRVLQVDGKQRLMTEVDK